MFMHPNDQRELVVSVGSDVVETVTFETETETRLKFRDDTEAETLS